MSGSMQSTILEEITEMSKLIVLKEFTIENVLCQAGDIGDGLFILLDGEIDIFVKGSNYKFCKAKEFKTAGTVHGEISFLLKTHRTATIVAASNCKTMFLEKVHKKRFQEFCPNLLRRLFMQIYTYKDDCIQKKKRLIRNSVIYFKEAEEKAVIELAFQSEVKYLSTGGLVYNQCVKMQKMILVQEGTLLLTLPAVGDNKIFERLH